MSVLLILWKVMHQDEELKNWNVVHYWTKPNLEGIEYKALKRE